MTDAVTGEPTGGISRTYIHEGQKVGKAKGPKGEHPLAPNGRDIIYLGHDQAPPTYQQPVLFDFAKQSDVLINSN